MKVDAIPSVSLWSASISVIESGVISPVDAARCLLSASASFFKDTINALTFSFSSTFSLISFADSGKLLHCY